MTKDIQQLPIEEITGFGLQTVYQEDQWTVGKWQPENISMIDEEMSTTISLLEQQGKTVISLTKNNQLMAIVGLLDVPKANASQVIDYFNTQNIQTSMITGDNQGTATAIAEQIGIKNLLANCTPAEKTSYAKL